MQFRYNLNSWNKGKIGGNCITVGTGTVPSYKRTLIRNPHKYIERRWNTPCPWWRSWDPRAWTWPIWGGWRESWASASSSWRRGAGRAGCRYPFPCAWTWAEGLFRRIHAAWNRRRRRTAANPARTSSRNPEDRRRACFGCWGGSCSGSPWIGRRNPDARQTCSRNCHASAWSRCDGRGFLRDSWRCCC